MSGARVLVTLGTGSAWSRGILSGFMAAAHERGWTLLHYDNPSYLHWLADALARLAIEPCHMRFLIQGADPLADSGGNYNAIPWRLGLLTQTP